MSRTGETRVEETAAPDTGTDGGTDGGTDRGTLVVQLVRGLVGSTRYQREVVRGLGLRRIGATASRPDNPMIRGMVRRVPHLVRIVEPAASAAGPRTANGE